MTTVDAKPHKRVSSVSKAQAAKARVPRPPNAWILYRSEKSQEIKDWRAQLQESRGENLNGKGTKTSRQRQADMSREIAQMWKCESPQVKEHYVRLSEQMRQEHRRRYPVR